MLADGLARTLSVADITSMQNLIPEKDISTIQERYTKANSMWNKGNHNLLSRQLGTYLSHFPKYVAQATLKEDQCLIISGHSHWWSKFVGDASNYNKEKMEGPCAKKIKNGQAVKFKISYDISGSNKYTVEECKVLNDPTGNADA
jgi:hypothetical protein